MEGLQVSRAIIVIIVIILEALCLSFAVEKILLNAGATGMYAASMHNEKRLLQMWLLLYFVYDSGNLLPARIAQQVTLNLISVLYNFVAVMI